MQPITRVSVDGRVRESIDPDDYRGAPRGNSHDAGFGLWSGTSFAAPVIAGRIADEIGEVVMRSAGPRQGREEAAVARAWSAVEKVTDIRRSESRNR
jgi:serine protease